MQIKTIATGSSGNCYLINNDLLIECGLSFKKMQSKVDISKVKTCLVSHEHADHAKSIVILETKMDMYAPLSTIKKQGCVMTKRISDGQRIHSNGYTIDVFKCYHDVETYGFVVTKGDERLLYASDTTDIDVYYNNITHLMIECNYDYQMLKNNKKTHPCVATRVQNTHMNIVKTFDYISQLNSNELQEVHLIHMSRDNMNNEIIKRHIPKTNVQFYIGKNKYLTNRKEVIDE